MIIKFFNRKNMVEITFRNRNKNNITEIYFD